jgi:integrase
MTITVPMLTLKEPALDSKLLRKALKIAFNTKAREQEQPAEIRHAISTARKTNRHVAELADPDVLRAVLRALDLKLDGERAAANTVRLRRVTLGNAIDYAIEKKLLTSSPLHEVKTKKRKVTLHEVSPQSVVNPMQARVLLDAVGTIGQQGSPLVAFFALMCYAALRPEEVTSLKKQNLSLPAKGWGDLHLEAARPEIGKEWTDSGRASEEGPLKHREAATVRTVPCPPVLTELLHQHLTTFGTARDGRLFRGAREGGRVGSSVYGRVWATARERVFTPEVVTTWLTGGVEATRVAKRAGHSLAVLLRVYAKCLDGGEQAARERVGRAFNGW